MLNKGQLERLVVDLKNELLGSGFLAKMGPNNGAYREFHDVLLKQDIPDLVVSKVLRENRFESHAQAYLAKILPRREWVKYFHQNVGTGLYVLGPDEICPKPYNSYFYLSNPTISEAGWSELRGGPWYIPSKTVYGFGRDDWNQGLFIVVHSPTLATIHGDDWVEYKN